MSSDVIRAALSPSDDGDAQGEGTRANGKTQHVDDSTEEDDH